jgi:hypothetical protein
MLLNDAFFAPTRKRECEDNTDPRVDRLCLSTDRLGVQLE